MNIDPIAADITRQLTELIRHEIEKNGGNIGFDRYMELALYAPGLGYYVNGSRKLGAQGDFTTAPEISDVYSRCLARQCQQVLASLSTACILEFGAGSGVMAADILLALDEMDCLPEEYLILELSPELQQRQLQTLSEKAPRLVERVRWLEGFPDGGFEGVILGNEVLDAMPVHQFRKTVSGIDEGVVVWRDDAFAMDWQPSRDKHLLAAVSSLEAELDEFAIGYQSEINLRQSSWLEQIGSMLTRGAIFLMDYGYEAAGYYHPERDRGTLICHFRHRAHDDVFYLPGLQDITANVDFSAVAYAAEKYSLKIGGYTTQANFLLGCGLDKILVTYDPDDTAVYLNVIQGVKQLTLPSEMGERFKTIALTRGCEMPLIGFGIRDLAEKL